jgi:hypothetical protein
MLMTLSRRIVQVLTQAQRGMGGKRRWHATRLFTPHPGPPPSQGEGNRCGHLTWFDLVGCPSVRYLRWECRGTNCSAFLRPEGPPSLRRVLPDGPADRFDQRALIEGLPQVADGTSSLRPRARGDIVKGRDEHDRDGYP